MNALKIAKIHNFDRYISFYSDLSLEEAEELCYKFKAVVEKKPSSLHSQIDYFFGIQGGYLSDYRGGAGAAGGSKGNQRAQGDGDCGSGE